MVDHPVDGCRCRHGILKDFVPLREDKVAADQHAAALVALRQEGEKHLHLFPVLLHVADVIEDHRLETIQLFEGLFQVEVAFGDEQLLHQAVGRHEQHRMIATDKLMTDGAQQMRFPSSWQAEGHDVFRPFKEVPLAQGGQDLLHPFRQSPRIQTGQGFIPRQAGGLAETFDTALPSVLQFKLGQVLQILLVAPTLALGRGRRLLEAAGKRRKMQRLEADHEAAGFLGHMQPSRRDRRLS